jgi:hypothetical protein
MSECPTCGGIGVVCIDDMCRGAGYCIHGDGDCPTCGGEPYEDDGPDDWDEPGEDDAFQQYEIARSQRGGRDER